MIWNPKSWLTIPDVYRDHYQSYARLRSGSAKRYRCELNRWERFVGRIAIRRVQTETFVSFRSRGLSEGLRADTIESTVKVVKAILRFCRDRGWISQLPLFGKALPSEAPDPEPATLEEIEALYLVAGESRIFGAGAVSPMHGMQAWLAIDLWTGLRLHDVTWRLSREHVHWRDRCIRFKASKTGANHVFPITEPVEWHLRLLDETGMDRLFGVHSGAKVDRELERLCSLAGIRKLTAQNIRQASVTEWDALGVGHLIHGCGLKDGEQVPRVMRRYLGVLRRLNQVAGRFPWPQAMLKRPDRQLRLF